MTANQYRYRRHDNSLLAGVCADLAQRLGWNVWALRVLFVLGLFIHAIATGLVYIFLGLVLPRVGVSTDSSPDLSSPELSDRGQRIADLERRFRDLEKDQE